MNDKLTEEQLAALPEKQQRNLRANPEVLNAYMKLPFLEAYAAHTDDRIRGTGYKAAVGADDANWETHGDLQRDFLTKMGLQPKHMLLEIGCGTGRLARKIVPYLDNRNYYGLDISPSALIAARNLSVTEGWSVKYPTFWQGDIPHDGDYVFDYAWAFSVFIHLPHPVMVGVMKRVAEYMHANARFYFSYVPEPIAMRSGVKQFRHTLEDYGRACDAAGLTFSEVPDWIQLTGREPGRWSGNQRVACATLRG